MKRTPEQLRAAARETAAVAKRYEDAGRFSLAIHYANRARSWDAVADLAEARESCRLVRS